MEKRISCKTVKIVLFTLLCTCFVPVLAWAGSDFTADFISKSKDPADMPGKGKIYVKDRMMRFVLEGNVMIFRPDKGVMWVLIEEEKMYMERPIQIQGRMASWTPAIARKARKVGKETVSGLSCTKYEILSEGKKTYYWISKKIDFPIKIQDVNGSMMLKDIQIGNLPKRLFELPTGYQKFNMPTMPGMMQGGGMPGGTGGMPGGMPGMPQIPGMPGGGNNTGE
ncbi:MAG: DUF4412 domain-containing protein [Deltaproteobacteria bacterium]|nr:DUF4412 domain-containing protein [Deltaproteobacteria bacterium]MBW2015546.1 DUF4412 domain-containing protein [Deltaproteobacteria bacterium]MBW2127866.1 DUF4412 domain-containing protein [Deltaproteobacteria bacterium]MBW2302882.1 DUF4412 domain-containing protein [Deltaproteobacteria bacterium]